MTELIFKKRINKKKLDSIIYFLKMMDVDVEIKTNSTKKTLAKDPFAEVRGIWADREVDARTLRNEAWKINE